MADRTLREILADIVDAGRRYPALHSQIMHCLFDRDGLRAGLFFVETPMPLVCGPKASSVELAVGMKLRPTDWLLQFAHALSRGVMPEMALPAADEFDGHEISHTREEHEATVSGDAFMRIPEYLNPE